MNKNYAILVWFASLFSLVAFIIFGVLVDDDYFALIAWMGLMWQLFAISMQLLVIAMKD